jgi:hypothetical protein
MYNWSVNTKRLKKDKKKYTIWKLQQLINFGLAKNKLNQKEIKKYFNLLNIDADKRKYLNFILYDEKPSIN